MQSSAVSDEQRMEHYMSVFDCRTLNEMYNKLKHLAKIYLNENKVPFSLSAIVHPTSDSQGRDVEMYLSTLKSIYQGDNSALTAKNLIEKLKKDIPKVSYRNPIWPEDFTCEEFYLSNFIFNFGLELPGSRYNPLGMGYFSDIFIDSFFGNITEFQSHMEKMSAYEKKRMLQRREGHFKYSIIFAPVEGIRMITKDFFYLTTQEENELNIVYSGNNENKHLEILEKLLEMGADPNAQDKDGHTVMHHLLKLMIRQSVDIRVKALRILLRYGADPNKENRFHLKPLDVFISKDCGSIPLVAVLIQHDAQTNNPLALNIIRRMSEDHGCSGFVATVRQALPRKLNECEKCGVAAEKKCSACSKVFYCSKNCQKIDWNFHKVTCKYIRNKK